jgi:3-oxoadipate enol-lactonase
MKVEANGININHQIDGPQNAPWLVLSNSLATNLSLWDEQVRQLQNSFRILRYDQRGHGGTDAPEGRYTFDLLFDDAVALMDALKIERAHFAGISMGGVTALGVAKRHPKRLDRIVVCDAGAGSTPATSQQWEERLAIAREKGMQPLVEPTVARWVPPQILATNAPHVDKVREMIRTTPVNGFIGCAAALANYDIRPGLDKLDHRALFMVGAQDATVAGMKEMHAMVPGAAYVELDPAGHISNLDQPEKFTRAMRDFLLAA